MLLPRTSSVFNAVGVDGPRSRATARALLAILPRRRVTMQVKNRKDYDVVLLYPVENSVREFVWNGSPHLAVHGLILEGILANAVQCRLDLCNKLSAQARTLSFVPPRRLPQVALCLPLFACRLMRRR